MTNTSLQLTEYLAMAAARKANKTTSTKSSHKTPTAKRKKVSKAARAAKVAKTIDTTAKKKATAGKATAGKASKPKPTRKSVDSILATFGKQRIEQQTKLATVQKKIAQLEAKTKANQAEIVSLKEAQSNAEIAIGKIDLDRDQAVRTLLEKLGINLISEPAAKPTKKKSTKKKSGSRKSPKAKNKTGKTRPSKKSAALESSPEDGAAAIQATPLFDTVFRSPSSSNGNPPASELLASSPSDQLLEDQRSEGDRS